MIALEMPQRASLTVILALLSCLASAAESTPAAPPDLNSITVHASKDPKRLKAQIGDYVSAITKSSRLDSLARWQVPVCPLVAGVSRAKAEYFLERISQIARDAGVPLAPGKCAPNLLIMITGQPDELLRLWQRRTPHLFSRYRGSTAVQRFVDSDLPVRAWYNANSSCNGMVTTFSVQSSVLSDSCSMSTTGSRLTRNAVKVVSSVIIVIDKERIKGLTVGQVADYVAMLGFFETPEEFEKFDAPSILKLFADLGVAKPAEMSSWDRAFLKSLYHSNARNVSQAADIGVEIFRDLVAEDVPEVKAP